MPPRVCIWVTLIDLPLLFTLSAINPFRPLLSLQMAKTVRFTLCVMARGGNTTKNIELEMRRF